MKKILKRNVTFLALLLMVVQLFFPLGNALASGSMLPPSDISYQEVTPDDIKLNWNSVYGAIGYNIYEITDGQLILKDKVNSNSYLMKDLPEGTYTFVISTLNSDGESGPSAPISFTVTYPEMVEPSNLSFKISNGNNVVLSWDALKYAESYNLYQVSEDGQLTLLASPTKNTHTITNVAEGNYQYAVSAVNSLYGESPVSAQIPAEVVHPEMETPSNFKYSITNGNDVTFSWTSVPFTTEYRLYKITDNGKELIEKTDKTSIKLTNVAPGSYKYEVQSYSDRFGESNGGEVLAVVVNEITMEAPANFSYQLLNLNDIKLTWNSAPNATSYKIYQIIDGEKVLKSTVSTTTTTYSKSEAGEYEFEIHSYNARFGESLEGSRVSLTIDHVEMQAPSKVTSYVKNGNDVVLEWEPTSNTTNYYVYQVKNDGSKVNVRTLSSTSTTTTFGNMAEGNYKYVVHSYSSRFGESAVGTETTVSVVHPEMTAPTNVTKTMKSETSFSLEWDAVEHATSYKIYQIENGEKVLNATTISTNRTFSNMSAGDYTYEIYSLSSKFGESKVGTQVSVTVEGLTIKAPTDLKYEIRNGNDIFLSWTGAEFATNYNVYQVIDGEKVLLKNSSSITTTISNQPEGDYHFVVHSNSTIHGESKFGAEILANLVHPKMEKPAKPSYVLLNGNDIRLSWEKAEYADSYNLYEVMGEQKELVKKDITSNSYQVSNVSEGKHSYVVHSVSKRFGESVEGSLVSLEVIHPTMQAPENLTTNILYGNDIQLKWTASDYAKNYNVYQIIDGKKVLQRTITGTSVTFTNQPEGDYEYEVHSSSDRFGESPESSAISLTLIHPIMKTPENVTNSISNGNNIVLKWNSAEFATGYNLYQIIDGDKVFQRKVGGTSFTFSNMPEGEYEYVVHSYSDRFGESPESSSIELTLIWPEVQPTQLMGVVSDVNNITLTWSTAEWASRYRVYQITNDSRKLIYDGTARSQKVYNLTEDTHSFEVIGYHTTFGESKPSNQITEKIVYPIMQPPVASLKLLSDTSVRITWDFVTYANGYNIYEIIDGEPVLIVEKVNNLSYTINNLSYANHEYIVTSYSNSFGESAQSNVVLAKLIIDEEAPVSSIDAPTDWVNESVDVKLTATDNEVGVEKTFYSLNNGEFVEGTTFSINEEGLHKVSYYSVDKVGNTEKVKTAEVKIDKTKPTTLSNVEDVWNNKDFQVELTASDNLSNIAKTFYSYDGLTFVEGASFTVKEEAENYIFFYSIDQAGNKEKVQVVEVKVDKTAPITTSDVQKAWSNKDVQVELTATDNLSGLAQTFYALNGSEYVEGTSLTVSQEGINEVSFYSVDVAGNVEDIQTVQVKIDKTAPVTTTNVENVWSNEDVQVELTATDNLSGVAQTFYAIDGSEFVEGTSLTVSEEGITEISVYSVDQAGNVEEIQIVQVRIDKTAPVTTSNVLDVWNNNDFQLELTATDNLSGVAQTSYSINGSEFVDGTSLTVSEEGITEVSFYSVDNAGNKEEAQTVQVKIDKTLPTIDLDVADEYALGTDLKLAYTASDNLSGIAHEQMTVNGQIVQNGGNVSFDRPGKYAIEVEATDHAGWTTKVTKTILVYIPATVEVLPKVMNGNKGDFTVQVSLPMGYSSKDFDLDEVTLNGVSALTSNKGYYQQAKKGQFKFERQDFFWVRGQMIMNFEGKLGEFVVKGQAEVKVIK
ncbi:OmpL47-type beta-barrel domain-containing protein [Bacillus sp. JJ1562]|uniref:OmpL47-type beta-barrel domain-containing protein n=1 Tax=Bacillus sp. JJ1562 TaxID=3122960 RepID=UPI003002451A